MREILFRGKGIRNGRWYYGSLSGNKTKFIHEYETRIHAPIRLETLGQYTGLTDKNDTKIFDGDILHFGDKNYLVFWNGECFQWQMRIRKDGFSFPIYCGQDTGCPVECITLGWVAAEIPILGTMSTEIVGNIYDNPELLK